MMANQDEENQSLEIAKRWCASKGADWQLIETAGRGGTAPVYELSTPEGPRALKLLDASFSEGPRGEETRKRLSLQAKLGVHDCPNIVKFYEYGEFEKRLYLLMSKAPGGELEKRLAQIPRSKIRKIVSSVAEACIYLRKKGLCHRDIKSANIFISDDFENTTLLDLSVLRDINDPVGLGTDHEGQLPVVATSRYSPPEYLFRLIEPSSELWHALDVYQLGGVLHDLIMRDSLFSSDYRLSSDNRYRFAWIVATQTPVISSQDVDMDLVFLARRALDKDWKRRSSLLLEDFLDTAEQHRKTALEGLGLSTVTQVNSRPARSKTIGQRTREVCENVDSIFVRKLREKGITATHQHTLGADSNTHILSFSWTGVDGIAFRSVSVQATIRPKSSQENITFLVNVSCSAEIEGDARTESILIPDTPISENVAEDISDSIFQALIEAASRLMQTKK